MNLKYFLFLALASCVLYVVVFILVVHKPLTIGIYKEYYDKKLGYLSSIQNNKIVILAGSNGRFSHRCETLEAEIGMPCSNMSITASISLDYQFEMIKPHLHSGDLVFLPLEYGALSGTKKDLMAGTELPYIMAYNLKYLLKLHPERLLHALFFFDIKFLISGLEEMLLDRAGIKRRFTLDTMTLQGDEFMHTSKKGSPYQIYLKNIEWKPPTLDGIDETSYKAQIVTDFMKWATRKNITIIGGLPTTFDDAEIPQELIRRLRKYYYDNGHQFLDLTNRSQYPRGHFFDTSYHLSEEFQIEHSKILSGHIKHILQTQ